MTDNAAPPAGPLVTGSEIARLAGVTRAAVSNWRRRYDDFPAPTGGSVNSPLFDLAEVKTWLDKQRKGQDLSEEVQLWQVLRGAYGDDMVTALADVATVLAGARRKRPEALPKDAVTLARSLADSGSPGEVVDALAERFTDSVRRAARTRSPRLASSAPYGTWPAKWRTTRPSSIRPAASAPCCSPSGPSGDRGGPDRRWTPAAPVSRNCAPISPDGRAPTSPPGTPARRPVE